MNERRKGNTVSKLKKKNGSKKALEDNLESFVVPKVTLSLSKAIQKARLDKKMSQKELAMRLNVRQTIITNYENGKARPSNLFISRMEKILGTKLPRIKKNRIKRFL